TALQARERDLIAAHAADWLAPWKGRRLAWSYRGGLCRLTPSFGRLRGDDLRDALDRAFVEVVRLKLSSQQLIRLVRRPRFTPFPALDLSGTDLTDAAVTALFLSSHAVNLCRLDLSNNRLGGAVLPLLLGPLARQLTVLDLRNYGLDDQAVSALLRPDILPRLRRVDLHGNDVSGEVLAEAAPRFPVPGRLVNSVGMELVRIPAGTFLMGSPDDEPERNADEGPQRPVTLTRPFYLGAYAVTQRQFETVLGDNPSHFAAGRGGG